MDDGYNQLGAAWQRIDKLEAALRRIAQYRPDGSYKLTREECEEVASKALRTK